MRAGLSGLGRVARFGTGVLLLVGCSQDISLQSQGSDGGAEAESTSDAAVNAGGDSGAPGPANGPVVVSSGDDEACNQVNIAFASPQPTVFILVDRSSSMFEQNLWQPLKTGVLEVVDKLESEVRFGFAAYTGERGGMCPDLSSLDSVALNNYEAIKESYDALAPPMYKGETPTARAIDEVTKLLAEEAASAADVAVSPTVILLVTDGEPDFCDDPNVTCSRDAVVASVQAAKELGIGTFIFSVGGQVDQAHLGDVANAGMGEPVEDRQNAVMNQCPDRRATYSASSGNAPYFEPDVNDQTALVEAINRVVSSVRSCTFDLEGQIEIDLAAANEGIVQIDGERVPYEGADGFRMNSSTQLELLGGACERLRQPGDKRVFIDFPCEAILYL